MDTKNYGDYLRYPEGLLRVHILAEGALSCMVHLPGRTT